MKSVESTKRSLVKTISYRLLIILATFLVSFWLSGDLSFAIGLTSVTSVVNTILYFLHERFWNGISWGRGKK